MYKNVSRSSNDAGFSLLELIIAMALTIAMLGIAATVLATGFRIREREESVSDAVADAQRALNIMSREIANAGFNLKTNGIIDDDSNSSSIRIRANLNRWDTDPNTLEASKENVIDAGEDVKFFVNAADGTNYLVRHDAYETGIRKTTVLANRMDSLRVHYFDQKVTYTTPTPPVDPANCDISNPSVGEVTPSAASYVVIALCVRMPAVGVPGTDGFQPQWNVLLVSDVSLRNSNLRGY